MNIAFDLVNLVGIVLETLIILGFFKLICKHRNLSFGNEIILCLVLILIQYFVMKEIDIQIITTLVMFLSIVVFSRIYKISISKGILLSTLLMIMFILSEIIIGLLLTVLSSSSVEQFSDNIFYYMQGVLISKLLMLVLIKAVGYFSIPSDERVSNGFFVALMILPIATFMVILVMSEYMYEMQGGKMLILSIVSAITLIASNIVLFYLYEYQLMEMENKKQNQLLQQQVEYKAEYYKELAEKQRITNKTMHDLKNQLFAIKDMLVKDKNDGIARINMICEDILASQSIYFTGNEAIDALITMKTQIMKEHSIAFTHSLFMPKNNMIDTLDLCVLLGNLMDNAIEANEKVNVGDRFVNLSIMQKENYLTIHISNSIDKNVVIENNKIVTTKPHKEVHGFGLKSVAEIVEKYNGSCVFKQKELTFHAMLMVKNE